jgi:hypothetical protein
VLTKVPLVVTLGLNCALKRSKENILGLLGSKYYQNEERSATNPLVYGRKRENQRYHAKLSRIKRTAFFIISLIILSDLSTIQFRLAFKDKGYKSLEYWGRLYERWISYPVDKSYPMDKSPIQWIAICRIKMRCTKNG